MPSVARAFAVYVIAVDEVVVTADVTVVLPVSTTPIPKASASEPVM